MTSFNATRLGVARKRRMLTKKVLAELVGVSRHTIERTERGETQPSAETIEKFSNLLNFPKSFFFGNDLDEPCSASFRSYKSMSSALKDAALSAGTIGFMLSDWVEKRFNIPGVQISNLSLYEPEVAARILREEWSLGEKPISNMIHLLESKGIQIFSLTENTIKVNAYSLWRKGKPYMFLNTFKSAESSRFDAAHELGHLVLHQPNKHSKRDPEKEADCFASSFLMPSDDVKAILPHANGLRQLIEAKKRWRVSLEALIYRMHKLNLLTDWTYRKFCIEIAKNRYNKQEPCPIEREKSLVWPKILRVLWGEKITVNYIAEELSLPISEIDNLIFRIMDGPSEQPDTKHILQVI